MASFTWIDWPGFMVRSRTIPFRLLSSEMTATRSAIGVTSAFCPAPRAAVGSWTRLPWSSSLRWQPAASSSASSVPVTA
ncbi:hypothetical protein H9L15_13965 [Sphingomonas daechungensis]|uniref:Uncharacterized protein n=1 Tax=Sphingomonas daechungensis TaxID=1176646 RepID=A0ABX6T422_9SPHN|nr:hypothetical protein [Sphingomonas daechungensis]QNP44539.1 hypothetical protein H9L15_13965 [Sphingomonas daechungensis]